MAPTPVTRMELTLQRDMPGFRGARHFVLEPLTHDAEAIFARLRCTDVIDLASGASLSDLVLLVMSPGYLWRDYDVEIDDAMVDELGLSQPDDVGLLVIVHPRDPLRESTANLYSPIVVNRRTGVADQLVPAASEQEVGRAVRTPFPLEQDD
jgi:flagellar assembly factor FliW